MSVAPSRKAPGRGRVRARRHGRRPAAAGGEGDVLEPPPRDQVRVRRDDAVVAHRQQRDRVNLEVQVVRRPLRVAGVADEADHLPCPHLVAVDGERREGGQVGEVELVPLAVAEPEAEAADVVPADREDRPVGDGENRRAERGEDVLAVVPGDGGPRRAVRVRERRRTVDREDVPARRQRGVDVRRQRPDDRVAQPRRHSRRLGRLRQPRLPLARDAGARSAWLGHRRRRGSVSCASGTGIDVPASPCPTRISVPGGSPACSAVSVTWSAVTVMRASFESASALASSACSSVTRKPQSASATRWFAHRRDRLPEDDESLHARADGVAGRGCRLGASGDALPRDLAVEEGARRARRSRRGPRVCRPFSTRRSSTARPCGRSSRRPETRTRRRRRPTSCPAPARAPAEEPAWPGTMIAIAYALAVATGDFAVVATPAPIAADAAPSTKRARRRACIRVPVSVPGRAARCLPLAEMRMRIILM